MFKNCDQCKKPFPADEHYQRLCLVCWKRGKGYELTKADVAFDETREALVLLRDEILDERKKSEALTQQLAEQVRVSGGVSRENRVSWDKGVSRLSGNQVEKLIRLCHPDKHKNSELSNQVTKWLLAQRKK